jgi:hypothetical protein
MLVSVQLSIDGETCDGYGRGTVMFDQLFTAHTDDSPHDLVIRAFRAPLAACLALEFDRRPEPWGVLLSGATSSGTNVSLTGGTENAARVVFSSLPMPTGAAWRGDMLLLPDGAASAEEVARAKVIANSPTWMPPGSRVRLG